MEWRCPPAGGARTACSATRSRFDSAEALTAALNSPVRKEMRADYAKLPAFSGRVTHYPMATSVLSSP